jgi:hypothetical protein
MCGTDTRAELSAPRDWAPAAEDMSSAPTTAVAICRTRNPLIRFLVMFFGQVYHLYYY